MFWEALHISECCGSRIDYKGRSKTTISELENISGEINKGQFSIEEGVEDIHSQIEFLLTRRIGETGKKIHSGRSQKRPGSWLI